MLKLYPAIFHNENERFWVDFPDVDGCFSDGDTLEEVMENAQEALALHISGLLDNELPIPAPSKLESLTSTDGFISYVAFDPNKYRKKNKAVKKTLTIPEWLNDEAEKRHINFSAILKNALLKEIEF